MSQQAALFDLDGVLIDSEGVYFEFWDNIDRMFPTGIPDFASSIKGSTLTRIMNYFPDEKVRGKIVDMLVEQELTMRYNIFDGVIPFLEDLKSHHIPCAIVTSSNENKMHRLFEQHPELEQYFKVVITDRQVSRSKPDPQGYLLASEKLNCEPANCIVFEDSYSGLEAGRRSGAKVVALATTNDPATLTDKADVVVRSFDQLSVEELFC